jgi:multiple sugar transport system permease protein
MRLALRTIFFALVTALFLFPIAYLIYISFKPSSIIVSLPTQWTFDPVLEHYQNVFGLREFELRGVNFVKPLLNSAVIAAASTALTVLIGTPAAYSLARLNPRGRNDIMLFILASRMAPAVVLLVPYFVI